MKIVKSKSGRVRCFSMTEAEYARLRDTYKGLCLHCGAERDTVEPDAEHYLCPTCNTTDVYGIEQVLILGLINLQEEGSEGRVYGSGGGA